MPIAISLPSSNTAQGLQSDTRIITAPFHAYLCVVDLKDSQIPATSVFLELIIDGTDKT